MKLISDWSLRPIGSEGYKTTTGAMNRIKRFVAPDHQKDCFILVNKDGRFVPAILCRDSFYVQYAHNGITVFN